MIPWRAEEMNRRKKIEGIFVCILLIATVFLPVAGIMSERENENSIQLIDHTYIASNLGVDVKNVKLNSMVFPYETPNDPDFRKQWYLHNTGQIFLVNTFLGDTIPIWFPFRAKPGIDIQALEAWGIETGSPDVVIAIPDTGVDYTHPDLAANIWNNTDEIPDNGIDDDQNGYIDDVRGWDFAYNDNDPMDDGVHGTLCAGIAGAVGNNGIGMTGVAWNCKIMPLKVWDETGWGSWENMAQAIIYSSSAC